MARSCCASTRGSSIRQPRPAHRLPAAAIRYAIDGGVEERELCWYGDESFTTHLWKVLGVAGFSAQLRFFEPKIYSDRRTAADQTHAEITAWREAHALEIEMADAAD